jgi:galactokinase/galacturonokinase
MQYFSFENQIESMNRVFASIDSVDRERLNYIRSPYRICPIGAHVDHQGGSVLGRTIEAWSVLGFKPYSKPVIEMYSMNYTGTTRINDLHGSLIKQHNWGDYLRGAVTVFRKQYPIKYGLKGLISGSLPASGLSSSASVGLAYLHAIAAANDIDLTERDFIELDRELENNYLHLDNGILDQSVIQLSRQGNFLYLNTRTRNYSHVQDPDQSKECSFLILYSGFSRKLVDSGFNSRVAECRQAAQILGEFAGIKHAAILSDVPVDVFEAFSPMLPENLRARAKHYYSEIARVNLGRQAWENGDFELFGRLMNESARSSIEDYQSGSESIIKLQKIVESTPDVFGSRFSGGGYGGCVIALEDKGKFNRVVNDILDNYSKAYPGKREVAFAFLAGQEDGVRLI